MLGVRPDLRKAMALSEEPYMELPGKNPVGKKAKRGAGGGLLGAMI